MPAPGTRRASALVLTAGLAGGGGLRAPAGPALAQGPRGPAARPRSAHPGRLCAARAPQGTWRPRLRTLLPRASSCHLRSMEITPPGDRLVVPTQAQLGFPPV